VNINKAVIVAIAHGQYEYAQQIMQNTIPLDSELSMHKPGAVMAYGIIAAGMGDMDLLHELVKFPFQVQSFLDIGLFGVSWFSPLIILSLYSKENYQAAAEILGFIYEKGTFTIGWLETWPSINHIGPDLEAKLGKKAYQQAFDRGKTMSFEDIRRYVM
jgi:hypothetical protein